MNRRTGAHSVLRAWAMMYHSAEFLALTVIASALCAGLSGTAISGLVVEFVSPIPVPIVAPVVAGVGIGLGSGTLLDRQILRSRPLFAPRILWALGLVAIGSAGPTLGAAAGDVDLAAVLRNCLLFAALGILSTMIFGAIGAWVGPTCVGLIVIVFGGARPQGRPDWAFMLDNTTNQKQFGACVAALLLTVVFYALHGDRRIRLPSTWT